MERNHILILLGVVGVSFLGVTLYMNQWNTATSWQWLQDGGAVIQTKLGEAWFNLTETLTTNPQNLLTGAVAASSVIIPIGMKLYNGYKSRAEQKIVEANAAIIRQKEDVTTFQNIANKELENLTNKVKMYEEQLSQTPPELLEAQQLVTQQQTTITQQATDLQKMRDQLEGLHNLIKGFGLKDDEQIVKTVVK